MTTDSGPRIQTFRLGDWEIGGFVERRFGLDGGWMFGVIPKMMWQKLLPPDDDNRIPMQANLALIKTGTANILLDTGLGETLSEADIRIYDPRGPSHMDESLRALGVGPDDLTHLIFTHLHTDHANGAIAGAAENPRLRFPNARYYVQRDEWEDAFHPDERSKAVYVQSRLALLENSGRLHLLDGNTEILPGISVVKTGGHTRGHQGVRVENCGQHFFYYADILPSHFHLKAPYVAAVDQFPLDTIKAKKALIAEALAKNAIIGFDHDIQIMFGRLEQKEKWIDVTPFEGKTVAT